MANRYTRIFDAGGSTLKFDWFLVKPAAEEKQKSLDSDASSKEI